MKSIPKISVVMSVYNGENTIETAINSILDQSFRDFEFIIINDGSTDKTLNILESYNDERIKIISQSNIGLTKSLNKAILLTKSNIIARQDADEFSHQSRLEIQFNYLKENDSISLIGSRATIIDGKLKMVTKKINHQNLSKLLMRTNVFIHGTVMFKKKDFLDIGLYNSNFK